MTDVFFCRIADGEGFRVLGEFIIAAWALAIASVALFPAAFLLPKNGRGIRRLIVGCAIFQLGHFSEHGGQVVGLGAEGGLTLTWWARQLVYGFAWITGKEPSFGLECMHFFGDLVYLSGVIAWWRLNRGRLATAALVVQSAHQIEHAYLISSAMATGEALGLTAVGPESLRVVIHFTLNFGGSTLWLASAVQARRRALP